MTNPWLARLAEPVFTTERQVAALLRALAGEGAPDANLMRPRRVALAGAPNVGKSSLLNALAGYERALAHDLPGTTRDAVREWLDLGGFAVEVLDLPGFEPSAAGLAAQAEASARAALAQVDAAILVLDGSRPLSEADRLAARATAGAPIRLVAVNKSDLPALLSETEVEEIAPGMACVRISCQHTPDFAAEAIRDALCRVWQIKCGQRKNEF